MTQESGVNGVQINPNDLIEVIKNNPLASEQAKGYALARTLNETRAELGAKIETLTAENDALRKELASAQNKNGKREDQAIPVYEGRESRS